MSVHTAHTPLKTLSLSKLVQERLLADIVTGRYEPGERLDLDEIAEECGVSRTPVREALQALYPIGFVAVARNARTVVADWSATDMRERALVIGRLIASLALEPAGPRASHDVSAAGSGDEYLMYLELATQMVAARTPRLSSAIQQAVIGPLRLFVRPDVLAAHGLGAPERRQDRQLALADALDALDRDDRPRAAQALNSYADEFATALTLPRPGTAPVSEIRSSHTR